MMWKLGRMNQISAFIVSNEGSQYEKHPRGRSGILARYRDKPIYAFSKLQKPNLLGWTWAEFMETVEDCTTMVLVRKVMGKLGIEQDAAMIVQENTGAIE